MPKKKTKVKTKKSIVKSNRSTKKKSGASLRLKNVTKKKKVSTKKKAVKKLVKKKAQKKKVSRKPKAKAKAKTKAKKSVVVSVECAPEEKSFSFAHDHHKKHLFSIGSVSVNKRTVKKISRFNKFSFPLALNQVRDSVSVKNQPPELNLVVEEEQALNLHTDNKDVEHSPYLLDLKRGVSVYNHKKVKPLKKNDQPQQEVLSIFEESSSFSLLNEIKESFAALKRSIKPVKSVNFAPIKNKFEPSRSFWRFWSRTNWQLSLFVKFCKKPLNRWNSRRLQKTMSLPDSLANTQAFAPLSKTTRGGSAIKSKDIQDLLIKRKKTERKKQQEKDLVTFSDWLKTKPVKRFNPLVLNLSLRRSLLPFVALCLVLTIPFAGASLYNGLQQTQNQVFGATNAAVANLQEARLDATNLDFIQASERFDQAGQAFSAAAALIQNKIGVSTKLLSFLPIVGKKLDAAQNLLDAGNELSVAASAISQGVSVFTDSSHFLSEQPTSIQLEYLFVHMQEAKLPMASAYVYLSEVDVNDLPENMRAEVSSLKIFLPEMNEYLNQMNDLADSLLTFLGHDKQQRYLVLFQNDTELRATGGFMGSLALVDIDRAEIQTIEIPGGGPYDFQASLFDNYKSPRALQLINPRWELQDANWFFDWPLSAEKVSGFYEKAGGPTVDGVIAINTKVLEGLLQFTGPITLPEYGVEVSAENFRENLQNNVEFDYNKELNQPKKIIADLAPFLFDRIKNLEAKDYIPFAQSLSTLLQEREILIYHKDESVLNSFSDLGWTGEVVDSNSDYLGIVHTNLAGGKTDGVVNDVFDLSVHINEKGQTLNTLLIRRTHTGEKGVPLIGVRNVDYMRVFVPQGSELVSATGFERPPERLFEEPNQEWLVDDDLLASQGNFITDDDSGTEIYIESNKTVFANWVQVDPGETVELKLVYKTKVDTQTVDMPKKDKSWLDWFTGETVSPADQLRFYRLYWQKQSGSWSPEMSVTINYPQSWQMQASSDINAISGTGSWKANALMKGDSMWDLIFY